MSKAKKKEKEITTDIPSGESGGMAKGIEIETDSQNITIEQVESELFKAFLVRKLASKPVQQGEVVQLVLFGKQESLKVTKIVSQDNEPVENKFYTITTNTTVVVRIKGKQTSEQRNLSEDSKQNSQLVSSVHQGVRDDIISHIQMMADNEIDEKRKFKAILVVGGEASGKTTLIKSLHLHCSSLANLSTHLFTIPKASNLSTLTAKYVHSNPLLQTDNGCFVLFIDDIHNVDEEKYLSTLQGLIGNPRTLIVGTALSTVSTGLAAVFDRRIDLPSLQTLQRIELIQKVCTGMNTEGMGTEEWKDLALRTSGFNLSDYWRLAKHTQFEVFRSKQNQAMMEEEEKKYKNSKPVLYNRIRASLSVTKPISLTFTSTAPNVKWTDIGGYDSVKQLIHRVVELPMKRPELFKKRGITPSKGILFYGPPGCSKTLFAKAIATESLHNFISISGPEVFSKYVGDSEKAIRDVFAKARLNAPCIIFFDEIDSIATKRQGGSTDVSDRVLIQLLTEMDGFQEISDVIVIGATNRPEILDPAIVRPGRLSDMVYISLPDLKAREEILKIGCRGMQLGSDVDLATIASKTEGYSGAEVIQLCTVAGHNSITRSLEDELVRGEDFTKAMSEVKPRISQSQISGYEKFSPNQPAGLFG